MNKGEFIEAIASKTDMSKAAAARAVDAMIDTITATVAKKGEVRLPGFGTFKAVPRKARTAKNPRTGAAIKVPATTIPRFTAGATFKAQVGKRK